LENGLYMIIPLEAGPEREWSENALIIASHLVSPGAVAYWSALRFWNMTEQLPRVQFIQTTKRKRSVSIKTIFAFPDALEFWVSPDATMNALGRLVKNRWLFRLENGLYMIIPLEAGPERQWSENALIIASHLVSPGAVAYWSALRFWNMTEQLPRVQFIQTTKRKRSVSIQGVDYRFVTVSEKRFFGTVSRQIEGQSINVTDREKTLIDAADRPDLSGGIVQLSEAMSTAQDQIDWEKLTEYLEKWGGGAAAKRLGYVLEFLGLPIPNRELILSKWQSMISKGISPLEPGSPKAGPTLVRWQLQINVPSLLPKDNR